MGRPAKITEEMVEFCIDCLARRLHKSSIKQMLAEKYGIDSARTAERVLARARGHMRARGTRDIKELVGDAIAFYESVIRSAKTEYREKIRAQEGLDRLLGLRLDHLAPTDDAALITDLAKAAADSITDPKARRAFMESMQKRIEDRRTAEQGGGE